MQMCARFGKFVPFELAKYESAKEDVERSRRHLQALFNTSSAIQLCDCESC